MINVWITKTTIKIHYALIIILRTFTKLKRKNSLTYFLEGNYIFFQATILVFKSRRSYIEKSKLQKLRKTIYLSFFIKFIYHDKNKK